MSIAFFKLLQWFFICGCIRITWRAWTTKFAAFSSPTFKCMRQRFVFLGGSQAMQMLLLWELHFGNH